MSNVLEMIKTRLESLDREREALAAITKNAPEDQPAVQMIEVPLGTLAEAERRLFLAALVATNYNKSAAAELLGVSRRSIYNRLAEMSGPIRCERCSVEHPPDAEWPLPNLCPRCGARVHEEHLRRARRLSDAGARAILRRAAAGENKSALADEYNVSVNTVKHLVAGRSYQHIPRDDKGGPLEGEHVGATLAGPVAA